MFPTPNLFEPDPATGRRLTRRRFRLFIMLPLLIINIIQLIRFGSWINAGVWVALMTGMILWNRRGGV
jgi:hypothetical protein